MLVVSFVIIILLVVLIGNTYEHFALVPIRYVSPTLYPTTGPVDMLIMKKFLIMDGYRFQNSLLAPEEINSKVDLNGQLGPLNGYPENFRKRMGAFKEKDVIERFEASTANGGASQATMAQLNSKETQDFNLIGKKGDPINDYGDTNTLFGKWASLAPDLEPEIKPFSWSYMINDFYRDPNSKDVVL